MSEPRANGTGDRSETSARVYFDYAPTGILETDARWQILRANPAAASITGHDRKQLLHLRLADLLAPGTESQAKRHLDLLIEQGIGRITWYMRRRDGTAITTEWESVQVADNLYIHIFDDVTAQRRTAAELEAARAAAEAANRAKSEFLANISHEIRTPMNGILGLSQLALMTPLTAEQREYLEKIAQSGRTLLKVINGLLDYAKIEAGKLEYERITFTLAELLDELATVATPAQAGLEVVFSVDADVPRALVGDRLRVGQILTNLLGNALKFTAHGTVELRVTAEGVRHGHCWVRFEVRDTGVGIEPPAMERLFQPFSQADAATARRFGGTGLGLAIARELAVGMGGELTAESQPGIGTRFVVRLPFFLIAALDQEEAVTSALGKVLVRAARPATRAAVCKLLAAEGFEPTETPSDADLVVVDLADEPKEPQLLGGAKAVLALTGPGDRSPQPEASSGACGARLTRPLTPGNLRRGLRELGLGGAGQCETADIDVPADFAGAYVIVAEDGPVNQVVILNLLGKAGIRTRLAEDGQAVLDLMAEPGVSPDLILMDVRMPGMDGLEATRTLRRRGVTTPIVGASAGASAPEQEACLQAGMNDFLPKPIDADELWGCLTRWIPPAGRRTAVADGVSAAERFLGDTDTLARARAAFIETHCDDARLLTEARSRGDREALAHIAHRLKGAAATVGADEVVTLAVALERHLVAQETGEDVPESLLSRLETALTRFR